MENDIKMEMIKAYLSGCLSALKPAQSIDDPYLRGYEHGLLAVQLYVEQIEQDFQLAADKVKTEAL